MIIPSTILQLWKIQSTSLSTSTVCSNIYCFNGIIEKHRVPNSNFLLTPSTLSTQPTLDALRTNQEETHVELYASKNNNGGIWLGTNSQITKGLAPQLCSITLEKESQLLDAVAVVGTIKTPPTLACCCLGYEAQSKFSILDVFAYFMNLLYKY